jgi:hypothetical protein
VIVAMPDHAIPLVLLMRGIRLRKKTWLMIFKNELNSHRTLRIAKATFNNWFTMMFRADASMHRAINVRGGADGRVFSRFNSTICAK